MIIIALGANLDSHHGAPPETIEAAIQAIQSAGIKLITSSNIYKTAPVPFDPDQPWYHNAVIEVETERSAHELLQALLNIEEDFGRVRTVKNAPRVLDLDLIAYQDQIIKDNDTLIVPHPRMHERLFVLKPLSDISKQWKHPVLDQTVEQMIGNLPEGQEIELWQP